MTALEKKEKHSSGKIRVFLSKGAKILLVLLAVRMILKALSRCFAGKK